MSSRTPRRRRVLVVLVATLAAVSVTVAAAPVTHAGQEPDLPPSTRAALARMFDPQLEKLGLRTTRALLQSLETYKSDPEGTHLAMYVEPIGEMSDAEYIANITKVSRIFLPKVFKRWSDLESFDVCQEPIPGVDDRESPPPVTQVLVSRKGSKRVSWPKASLEDVVRAATTTPDASASSTRDFFLFVNAQLAKQPAYQAALTSVRATTTSSAPTTQPAR